MKKATVYILALILIMCVLLAGCGENLTNRKGTSATEAPKATVLPETMMPDPGDGVVNDEDGIITDDDTGTDPEDGEIRTGDNDMENRTAAARENEKNGSAASGNGMTGSEGMDSIGAAAAKP